MMVKALCFSVAVFGALPVLGCESKKEPEANAFAQIASSKPLLMGARPAAVQPAAGVPARPVIRHPSSEGDLVLTEARRAKIEQAFPEAKGFIEAAQLERDLYKLGLRRGKDAKALAQLDRLAQGKWVLFTGNPIARKKEGFSLPVRYTPRDPNDRLGLTSTWLTIEFSNISGYDSAAYQPEEPMVVLARYEGKDSAGLGHDLVLSNQWFVGTE
jgi:hypothetical protein